MDQWGLRVSDAPTSAPGPPDEAEQPLPTKDLGPQHSAPDAAVKALGCSPVGKGQDASSGRSRPPSGLTRSFMRETMNRKYVLISCLFVFFFLMLC